MKFKISSVPLPRIPIQYRHLFRQTNRLGLLPVAAGLTPLTGAFFAPKAAADPFVLLSNGLPEAAAAPI